MKRVIVILIATLLLGGCDWHKGKREKGSEARVIKEGASLFNEPQREACIQNYDPIFCDERYAGGLNAGVERNETVARYEDNTTIYLDKNKTGVTDE